MTKSKKKKQNKSSLIKKKTTRAQKASTRPTPAWEKCFQERGDLSSYKSNAIGLFALALRFGLDDLNSIAANAITDGNDDKKCDIIHIDKDEGYAVIMQCYISTKAKASAPSNKASDLNTAIGWLLQHDETALPERIRPLASELRQGLLDNSIKEIYIWYVHNLPESSNVKGELKNVHKTTRSIIEKYFPDIQLNISISEVGSSQLEDWYKNTQSPILVSDSFDIEIPEGFEVKSNHWKAFVTTIPASFLYEVYNKYKTKLFSANVRDYLGSRKSDMNINNGIKRSAQETPHDFWVFNNGLTILVNKYTVNKDDKKISISGLSIVNGAQTTGAIGSLPKVPDREVVVPVRFVITDKKETIFNIIEYNNSQNKVTASDFRSRDKFQERLRKEFDKIPEAEYQGGRRGSALDIIQRNPYLLPSYTVGQVLAAMHLDPDIAYNQKSEIWANDALYSKYFNDNTTGPHIVLAYSLLRSIEAKKSELVIRSKDGASLTDTDKKHLEYFRQRGSIYLLMSSIANCLEIILKKHVDNISHLSFGNISPKNAEKLWQPIIEICVAFCPQLQGAFTDGLKNKEKIKSHLETFQSLVKATATANKKAFHEFASRVKMK